jgi:hypothetical protein
VPVTDQHHTPRHRRKTRCSRTHHHTLVACLVHSTRICRFGSLALRIMLAQRTVADGGANDIGPALLLALRALAPQAADTTSPGRLVLARVAVRVVAQRQAFWISSEACFNLEVAQTPGHAVCRANWHDKHATRRSGGREEAGLALVEAPCALLDERERERERETEREMVCV